ncbi:MAG: TGS domain-containing protein [Lachnospiraceae bacterium]|nr:TGS domain-containing protein [Lachnospiraceae bacterium]
MKTKIPQLYMEYYADEDLKSDLLRMMAVVDRQAARSSSFPQMMAYAASYYIAYWSFDLPMIAAALFHHLSPDMIPEDCPDKTNVYLNELARLGRMMEEGRENTEILSALNYREVIYILVAERLYELRWDEGNGKRPPADLLKLARDTETGIKKLAYDNEAIYLADLLSEMCFHINDHERYTQIRRKVEELRKYNIYSQDEFFRLMRRSFDPKSNLKAEVLKKERSFIKSLLIANRSLLSIEHYLERGHYLNETDFDRLMAKDKVALYELTLVLKNEILRSDIKPIDIFLTIYRELLQSEHIYIMNYGITMEGDSSYLMLCDSKNNQYRLFIKTESQYHHFRFGNINKDQLITRPVPKDPHKITVFQKDGRPIQIQEDATLLDLAFQIHTEMGIHFDYAIVNEKSLNPDQFKEPISVRDRRLQEGDTVVIEHKPHIFPDVTWLNDCRTSYARNQLIQYLSASYNRLKETSGRLTDPGNPYGPGMRRTLDQYARLQDKLPLEKGKQLQLLLSAPLEIKVFWRRDPDKEAEQILLPYGSTLLDLAFKVMPDEAVHFSYARLEGRRQFLFPKTLLNDGDSFILYFDPEKEPDLGWFRYIKTPEAFDILARHFT